MNTTTQTPKRHSESFRLGFAAGYEASRDGRFTSTMALYDEASQIHNFPASERLIDSEGFGYNPAIDALGDFCNGVSSGLTAYSDELCGATAAEVGP